MGCKNSKTENNQPPPTAISPTSPNRKKPDSNDRYCKCVDKSTSKSFVCPVCRKIKIKVKNDVRQVQRKQKKISLPPTTLRKRTTSHEEIEENTQDYTQDYTPPTDHSTSRANPQQHSPQQPFNSKKIEKTESEEEQIGYDSTDSIKRAGSLQRRSEQFLVVSHKVSEMVDISK